MNNKAKIVLGILLVFSGVSQLCATSTTGKKPQEPWLVRYGRKLVYGLEKVDQYSHGVTAVFATCCVAPWLASKGQTTIATNLAAGALGNFGVRLLGDWGKSSFEAWASKKPEKDPLKPKEYSFRHKNRELSLLPSLGINLVQVVLRRDLCANIMDAVIASQKAISSKRSVFDNPIILGGLAYIFFDDFVLSNVPLIRSGVDAVGLKMLWPAWKKGSSTWQSYSNEKTNDKVKKITDNAMQIVNDARARAGLPPVN
ncbi:MAG: hypothetical protein UV38_C0002G0015 [candidate division TM6 bacterium GW2011_GWE2_42_60]|nr:MAG: hypothetical protein UV38_C0002G0015 [candidate division TM6 bacterium GW2011_GWE2_42_60]